jgi:hypothetical protein
LFAQDHNSFELFNDLRLWMGHELATCGQAAATCLV